MLETCKSCGTVFEVNESILTEKIQWFKCGVCSKKWSSSSTLYINQTFQNNEHKNKSEKVRSELASIKSVVEDKSKILAKKSNPVLDQKNKSVAEIGSELSLSKLHKKNNINNKDLNKRKDKQKTNITKKNNFLPFIIIFIISVFSLIIFFRSLLISYSFIYFPNYTKNYIAEINSFFNKIELPILAQINYLNLNNFIATLQEKEVRFTGIIKNNSNRPILMPRIKILAIREDRKIIFEKTLILEDKIILPNSEIIFNKTLKIQMDNKKENVTVRATLIKKVFDY